MDKYFSTIKFGGVAVASLGNNIYDANFFI